jgi:tripartite-type tricarboxylate transporter receptor subunit TctC
MRKQQLICNLLVIALALVLLLNGFAQIVAAAEKYPDKPIRIIVSHVAGGATDLPIRIVGPQLQKYLGVPVVIENMVGAGGNIARTYVYKQPADGYTFLVTGQPSFSTGAAMSSVDFDPTKFTFVYNIVGKDYQNISVKADSPLKDLNAIIEESKKKQLTMAISGIGSLGHLATMTINNSLGVNIRMVPYDSSMACAAAVANGEVDMGSTNTSGVLALAQAGRIKVMAIQGAERVPEFPDVLTVGEMGHPELAYDYMLGVYGPPGIPKEKLDILVVAFEKAMKDEVTIKGCSEAKLIMEPLKPEEFEKRFLAAHDMVMEYQELLKSTSAGN